MTRPQPAILIINAGSSSLKFAVYVLDQHAGARHRRYHGAIEGMDSTPRFRVLARDDKPVEDKVFATSDHQQAMAQLLQWLGRQAGDLDIVAAGHRLVHGGERFSQPLRLTAQNLAQLREMIPLAPLHMPHNLAAIEALWQQRPGLPQVACFDTAFHHHMPPLEQIFALPRQYREQEIRRYGFHGLSYEYIASILPEHLGKRAEGRVIVAHLGHGASLCALLQRKSMATTMGFTPLDGIPMATRPGAIDAGVLLYLLREKGLSLEALEALLNHQSGLLGLSGSSGDMRELLADSRPSARLAIDYFVHHTCRAIGSLAAVLSGLDALVFTAGIGEHAPPIRAAICASLGWLGIELDTEANTSQASRISTVDSRVTVCVIPTDEEQIIARHTASLLFAEQGE